MNELSTTTSERDARPRALVPPERLARCAAVVIGVGALGRQVALLLAALGMPRLTLFDGDVVQAEKLASQGYWTDDLNQPKVNATARLCRCMQPLIQVTAVAEPFTRSTLRTVAIPHDPIIFCCVDNIPARRMIWETIRASVLFFVDGRMVTEIVRVLAVDDPVSDDDYPLTLLAAEEGYTGACAAVSTLDAASICAGWMVHQFAKWLRGLAVDADVTLNLLATQLTVGRR